MHIAVGDRRNPSRRRQATTGFMSERFELAHAAELQPHLSLPDGKNTKMRRAALRKVVSNIIVNNPEMLALYPEVLHCLQSSDSETKRMCLLYLETYVKSKPRQMAETLQRISKEVTNDQSPTGIRAVALRTLSSIPSKSFATQTLGLIPDALKSPDPYFRKTACFAVAKAWSTSHAEVENSGVLGRLNQLLIKEPSPVVVAAAAQALLNITDQSVDMDFVIDFPTTKRLAHLIGDCPEFSQVSLLTAIAKFVPQVSTEAEELARLITPGLRHTNAAVSMGTARVLLMLSHYSTELSKSVIHQVFGPLLSQLNRPPEIQYSILRNIQLLLQAVDPDTLKSLNIAPQTFFCKGSDFPYIRATKIDILTALCVPSNAEMVLKELIEFIHIRNDPAAQRRAIGALAKLATKYESIAPRSVQVLKRVLHQRSGSEASSKSIIETEEAAISQLILLIRRYPDNQNLIDQALSSLLNLKDIPQHEEARSAYLWLLGTYSSSPDRLVSVILELMNNIAKENSLVQLSLMTASLKAFSRFPRETSQRVVPKIFEIAASQCVDPDVRDRALFYWRLLSQNPTGAEAIVVTPLPPISKDEQLYDYSEIEDLELSMGYLSSIYLKPADRLFRLAHTRQLQSSPALLPRKLNKLQELAPREARPSLRTTISSTSSTAFLQLQQQQTPNFSPMPGSQGVFPSPPPPPAPRPRNARQTSVMDQFHDLQINLPSPDDQNERLIDI